MKSAFYLVAILSFLPVSRGAANDDFVVINATASAAYAKQKFAGGSPKPESYIFYQGKYFDGVLRDPSIDGASFTDIAKVLAPHLAKQNYFPTTDVGSANLLIIVNWGTTSIAPGLKNSDPEKISEFNGLMAAVRADDFSAITQALGAQREGTITAGHDVDVNAALLGYSNALNKEKAQSHGLSFSAETDTHLADLTGDRYFVILLAYDYQEILRSRTVHSEKNPKPGDTSGQPKPVWSVRMNIRASGNNFTEALPAMSRIAADYFGKQMDDLLTAPATVGTETKAHVDVGPTKVLGVVK